jgi:hypothetical protein
MGLVEDRPRDRVSRRSEFCSAGTSVGCRDTADSNCYRYGAGAFAIVYQFGRHARDDRCFGGRAPDGSANNHVQSVVGDVSDHQQSDN